MQNNNGIDARFYAHNVEDYHVLQLICMLKGYDIVGHGENPHAKNEYYINIAVDGKDDRRELQAEKGRHYNTQNDDFWDVEVFFDEFDD